MPVSMIRGVFITMMTTMIAVVMLVERVTMIAIMTGESAMTTDVMMIATMIGIGIGIGIETEIEIGIEIRIEVAMMATTTKQILGRKRMLIMEGVWEN
jgi:hypothetical protein